MKKRKVLVSLLCATALLGVSAGTLTSCKKTEEPENPTPEVQKFTVTFDAKGGSDVAKIENLTSGSKIAKPNDPTRKDFTFAGWYKDSDCTQEWKFDTDTVTENVTLYAKWTPVEKPSPEQAPVATLVYDNGTADGTLTAVKDENDGKYYFEAPAEPEKDYFTFDAWYTDEDHKTAYIWNTEAVDGLKLYANYNQKYDSIYTQFDFAAAKVIMGDGVKTSKNETVGRFTCAAGCRIDGGAALNTQGQDVTFELKGEGTGNSITVTGSWASSSKKGSVYITNTDTNKVVGQLDGLENKSTIELNVSNLPAGHYSFTSEGGASIKITALALTEKLPQGPTNGIALDISSVQTQYLAGRAFSTEGLVVYLAYDNGRKDEIETAKYSISQPDMTTAGKKEITITYNKDAETTYTQKFDIYVYAIEELVVYTHVLDGKRITHNAQTLFALNSTFNSNNIAVKAKCLLEKAKPEDPQEYIEFVLTEGDEYVVTNPDLTTVGQKSVKIEYKADTTKVANYDIEVVDIPDYSNETMVAIAVDPTHELGVDLFGPADAQTECFYVHTINQALQFFELAKVQESAEKAIGLKAGTTYHEKVEINMPNVMMTTIDPTTGQVSNDPTKYAVIEYNGINGQLDPSETTVYSTDGSATVSIRSTATNFQAMAVKFNNYWNTAERYAESLKIYGNGKTQAVAVLVQADKVAFDNCYFSSYQDTLYAKNGRQYYYQCYIEGHTDFIFGDDATAVFDDCDIMTIGNGDEANGGYVVATKGKTVVEKVENGEITKELKYGYVFDNCDFIADADTKPGTTSLGRAWAAGMSMMVMNSRLGVHLSKEAYKDTTSGKNDRYGNLSADPNAALILEYKNSGEGAIDAATDTTYLNSTCTILKETDEKVADYTAENKLNKFFGADNGSMQYGDVWMPAGYGQMDATVVVKGQDGSVLQTLANASYVGSTITNKMLDNLFTVPAGYELDGYYSDQACTTPYDFSTVLLEGADANVIYAKLTSLGDITYTTHTLTLPDSSTTWTAETTLNDFFTLIPASGKNLKTEGLKNGAVAYGDLTFGPQQLSMTAGKASTSGNAIKIVLTNEAKVTIYCGSKNDKQIKLAILDANGNAATLSDLKVNDVAKDSIDTNLSITAAADKYEFTLAAGTYYIGGTGGGCYIYGMTVDVRNA